MLSLLRRTAITLCAGAALLSTSCIAVLPHNAQTDLVAEDGLEAVTQEFRKVTLRSVAPVIRAVDVDEDTVRLEVSSGSPHFGMWWTGAVVQQGQFSIYLPVLDRYEVYENNKVFLYQNGNQRIMEILFGNNQDPKRFVDLLFSLKAAISGGEILNSTNQAEPVVEEMVDAEVVEEEVVEEVVETARQGSDGGNE